MYLKKVEATSGLRPIGEQSRQGMTRKIKKVKLI
jgi:hypothetical protein